MTNLIINQQESNLPLVSVLVITYNHEGFIEQCLDGIFSQDYPNIELLIRDDGSHDKTRDKIEGYFFSHQGKISNIFKNFETENIGVVRSLNSLLDHVKGNYICLCSGDDFYSPGKIRKQVEFFQLLPTEYGVVYGDLHVIDLEGNVVHPSFYQWHLSGDHPPQGDIFRHFIWFNPIHPMSVLVRREVIDQVGRFDEKLCFEDWDIGMRWARNCKFHYHNDIVGSYRKYTGQMTDVFWADDEKHARILQTSFMLLSKHIDLPAYKDEILKSQSGVLMSQLSGKHFARKEGMQNALFLLRNKRSLRHSAIFILIFFNIGRFSISLLKKAKTFLKKGK